MIILNSNHHVMRCKTTMRHLMRPWYFVLVADMQWIPRITWFWQTALDTLKYGSWQARIKTGPPLINRIMEKQLHFDITALVKGIHKCRFLNNLIFL